MTKEEFYTNCEKLKENLLNIVNDRIKKAAESGCIDFDKWDNNYLLPTIVFSAIGREIEHQFKPLNKKHQKEVDNIYVFL